MAHGIQIFNELTGALTVSNTYLNLCYTNYGTAQCNQEIVDAFKPGWSNPYTAVFDFPAITPMVAIRSAGRFAKPKLSNLGNGNWRCSVQSDNINTIVEYFVFDRYSVVPDYGVAIRNDAGDLTFTTGQKPMVVKSTITSSTWLLNSPSDLAQNTGDTQSHSGIGSDALLILGGHGSIWQQPNWPVGTCEVMLQQYADSLHIGAFEHTTEYDYGTYKPSWSKPAFIFRINTSIL